MASTGEVRRASTLGELFDSRANGFGFVRLALAVAVVVSHAFPAGGFSGQLGESHDSLGTLAVIGFFAVSGFLITASAARSRRIWEFLLRRVLRIVPAYWTVLFLIAFAAAPIAQAIGGGTYTSAGAQSFLAHNLLLNYRLGYIGTTLASVPLPNTWDVSLWTLIWEFYCYLLVALLAALRALRPLVVFGILVAFWQMLQMHVIAGAGADDRPFRFVTAFLVGALLWLAADKVPTDGRLVAAIAAVACGSYFLGGFLVVGVPAFAYLVVWAGAVLPWRGVGTRRDLSYGIYLYGWPVEQLLALAGVAAFGFAVYLGAAVVLSAGLAWLSWTLVEKPAMNLRSRVRRSGLPLAAVTAP